MRLFGKNNAEKASTDVPGDGDVRPVVELSPGKQAGMFEAGLLPCPDCGSRQDLDDLVPFTMVECAQCNAFVFVPRNVGDFWLFEPLGGGGMGSVYKASRSDAPEDLFAVKILGRSREEDPTAIAGLRNEAETAQALGKHPNIADYVNSDFTAGEEFLATQFTTGKRLDSLIRARGKLPIAEALHLGLDILAAEEHIYACGFLYRDLKPENVLADSPGHSVLIDYGLCIPREDALNPEGDTILGSPYYLPPERIWALPEDSYSEIYSLGMVLYHALQGKTFFSSGEKESLARRHISKMRLTMASKLRGFPTEVVELLDAMTRQEHNERFQTFAEAMDAIQEVLASEASASR